MIVHDSRPPVASRAVLFALAVLLTGLPAAPMAAPMAAPAPAAAQDNDPHAWLEAADSPRALAWVEAENAATVAVLKGDPRYERFYAEALAIAENEDRIPRPEWVGERLVNFRREAAHPHGIWRLTTPESFGEADTDWETLLDLDALAASEGRNWVWKGATCEPGAARRCLVGLSDGGTDALMLREFDLENRRFVADGFVLPTSKQFAAWLGENTLLVARDWGDGSLTASGYPFIVKRLERGAPLDAADVVFRAGAEDQGPVRPLVLDDGDGDRAVLLLRSPTFHENEIHLLDDGRFRRLPLPGRVSVAGLLNGKLVARLNEPWQTPADGTIEAGAIVAAELDALREGGDFAVETIFAPGARQAVQQVSVTRSTVVAAIYDNVRGAALAFTPAGDGWRSSRLPLPENVSVYFVATSDRRDDAYAMVTGYLHPETLWAVHAVEGTATPVKSLPAQFDAATHTVAQYEAISADGTRIPYFVVRPADAPRDGSTPTILTAYGGFQVSHIPKYEAAIGKLWLERGGAYAVANIRGGGEFGPAWHQAGLKTKRQTVYDDFAAVGENLAARGLTSRRRLGIMGGSNGGLLMGVALTQRPDLWRGVVIRVPLLDMLRYERIAAGASWVAEYGSASVPAERAFLEKTSPYENLERDAEYPQPLIWTTAKDDRVGPGHARKFAARMKAFGHPYYYYENLDGGHSGDADLAQVAELDALQIVYFARKLMPARTGD